uniref:T9SS type A sorting domain-containing protein n=1 Tax=candidate division WOR-3 bacterium TaxID=2052148 RepID=A0A7C3Z1U8_UNCW3
MRYTKIAIVVSLLVLSPLSLFGQPLPCKTYGGIQSERCFALVPADTGYCLAGWTKSFGPGTPQFTNVLIVKTNQLGIPQWAKMSIGLQDDEAYSMVRTFDGGYALTGWTKSYGVGAPNFSNIFVLKLNSIGIFQWGKVFGGDSNDQAYSIIQTNDSGYAVAGWTRSFGPPPMPNIIVLKLDKNGNLQWANIYWQALAAAEEEGYGITELKGAPLPFRYAVCGRFRLSGQLNWNAFVMALDTMGNVLWVRDILPELHDNEAYSVVWDSVSGTIGVAGWTNNFGPNAPPFANLFVWRLTFFGGYVWGKVYGWAEDDEKVMDDRSLIVTSDGGYAVAGWTKSKGPSAPPNPNFLILKLNPMGTIQWSRVHPSMPGANFEEANPMIQTINGYAIAGWTSSFGLGGDDFHFLTLDPNGNRPACVLDSVPMTDSFWQINDSMIYYYARFPVDSMVLRDTIVRYTDVCTTGVKINEAPGKIGELSFWAFTNEIRFNLSEDGNFQFSLYDVNGRQVLILAKGFFKAGEYTLTLPHRLRGLYFLELNGESKRKTIKVLKF